MITKAERIDYIEKTIKQLNANVELLTLRANRYAVNCKLQAAKECTAAIQDAHIQLVRLNKELGVLMQEDA